MVPALCEGSSPGTRADAQCAGTCAPQRARMCQPSAPCAELPGRQPRRARPAAGRGCAGPRLRLWGELRAAVLLGSAAGSAVATRFRQGPGFAWQTLVPGCALALARAQHISGRCRVASPRGGNYDPPLRRSLIIDHTYNILCVYNSQRLYFVVKRVA
jgi:hypothetical protein